MNNVNGTPNSPWFRIYATQSGLMQRCPKMVADGYRWWTGGTIESAKLPALVEKFAGKYAIAATADQRARRRRDGLANARLLAATIDQATVRWLLRVSDGEGAVREQEALQDTLNPREALRWGDYEMKRTTRPREFGGGSRFTWWIDKQVESEIDRRASGLAQGGRADALGLHLKTCIHRPLFSGVRTQIRKVISRARAVWRHHHPERSWPGPDPDKLPWLGSFRKAKTISAHIPTGAEQPAAESGTEHPDDQTGDY